MSSFFVVLVISPFLVLIEDHWKALNEKSVAVAYVGTKSVISPEIVVPLTYIYICVCVCVCIYIYILYFSPGGQGRLWQ